MKPTQHNTRPLSRGDQITKDDFCVIPETMETEAEFLPIEMPEVGMVLSGDEEYEYRRYCVDDPFFTICWENGIVTPRGVEALRKAIEVIANVEKKRTELQALEAKLFW
jgi:hypothetical protein